MHCISFSQAHIHRAVLPSPEDKNTVYIIAAFVKNTMFSRIKKSTRICRNRRELRRWNQRGGIAGYCAHQPQLQPCGKKSGEAGASPFVLQGFEDFVERLALLGADGFVGGVAYGYYRADGVALGEAEELYHVGVGEAADDA